MGYYDVAQICLNGHVVNESSKIHPQFNQKYCKKCGAKTITNCPDCNEYIRGKYHVEGIIDLTGSTIETPPFCINCGKAYPWTAEKIKSAKEFAMELDNLSKEEKEMLSRSIESLIADTPRTQLEATRFKKLILKAGTHTAKTLRDILVDITSETAKKMIWGQ